VRGDHDGPLFCALHHRAPGRRAQGANMPAGDIREVIGDLARLVGLPASVSGYSLRRSWATHCWLEDPNALARISLQLRHATADVTVRYIDDLRLQTVDAQALLSPAVVVAGSGGQPGQRKDLGFTPLLLEVLVERAETLSRPAGRRPRRRSQTRTRPDLRRLAERQEPRLLLPAHQHLGHHQPRQPPHPPRRLIDADRDGAGAKAVARHAVGRQRVASPWSWSPLTQKGS
jgi:hypothetical protein